MWPRGLGGWPWLAVRAYARLPAAASGRADQDRLAVRCPPPAAPLSTAARRPHCASHSACQRAGLPRRGCSDHSSVVRQPRRGQLKAVPATVRSAGLPLLTCVFNLLHFPCDCACASPRLASLLVVRVVSRASAAWRCALGPSVHHRLRATIPSDREATRARASEDISISVRVRQLSHGSQPTSLC